MCWLGNYAYWDRKSSLNYLLPLNKPQHNDNPNEFKDNKGAPLTSGLRGIPLHLHWHMHHLWLLKWAATPSMLYVTSIRTIQRNWISPSAVKACKICGPNLSQPGCYLHLECSWLQIYLRHTHSPCHKRFDLFPPFGKWRAKESGMWWLPGRAVHWSQVLNLLRPVPESTYWARDRVFKQTYLWVRFITFQDERLGHSK